MPMPIRIPDLNVHLFNARDLPRDHHHRRDESRLAIGRRETLQRAERQPL